MGVECCGCGCDRKETRAYFCPVCADLYSVVRGRAQRKVRKAIQRGKLPALIGQQCVDCGRPATDYDHRKYSEPLLVAPTCRRCNLMRGPALDVVECVKAERLTDPGGKAARIEKWFGSRLAERFNITRARVYQVLAK